MRTLLSFKPKCAARKGSLIQAGTEGYTYGFEIEVSDNRAAMGKYYYPCAMPVYRDDGGEYVDFTKAPNLKDVLGKIYLSELAAVAESVEAT
jgi:hypothetical protein